MKYALIPNLLYIHWPHITVAYLIDEGIDGDYIVFDENIDLLAFVNDLEDSLNTDLTDLELHCFGATLDNAVRLDDLIKILDDSNA